jgi:hypothetical protein
LSRGSLRASGWAGVLMTVHVMSSWLWPVQRWLAVPVMRVWKWVRRARLNADLQPAEAEWAHAAGFNSDRILIYGAGPATGQGVLRQDLALPGWVARDLATHTGRGADVHVIADLNLSVQAGRKNFAFVDLDRYDVVVLVFGLNAALDLTSLSVWEKELRLLLSSVNFAATEHTPVFVTGIPAIWALPGFGNALGRLCARHAACLEQVTKRVCAASPGATFVPLAPVDAHMVEKFGSGQPYSTWGAELADAIAPSLDVERAATATGSVDVVHNLSVSETQRRDLIRRVGLLDPEVEQVFGKLLQQARELFGASGSALAVIDGDTVWLKSRTGISAARIPFEGSFASATMGERGAFIVPNALADPRFSHLPVVTGGPKVRFWCGFPIEADNGVRVAILVIFDDTPRDPDAGGQAAALREFALLMQAQLRPLDGAPLRVGVG